MSQRPLLQVEPIGMSGANGSWVLRRARDINIDRCNNRPAAMIRAGEKLARLS
jgi:hypothetical protein